MLTYAESVSSVGALRRPLLTSLLPLRRCVCMCVREIEIERERARARERERDRERERHRERVSGLCDAPTFDIKRDLV
jgi:hypothetical protein